jgi:hypothetical protein
MMYEEKLQFREFVEHPPHSIADWELVNLYHSNPALTVRELAIKTNKSIGEVYRTLRRAGGYPNRQRVSHESVKLYDAAGLPRRENAMMNSYSHRHIRRILSGK